MGNMLKDKQRSYTREVDRTEQTPEESERENKALKRVQARQERELLKAESARHSEGSDASRAHAEEVRALRALLAEGRDRLREYEKKLHVRNCELQKLRQALAEMQRQLDEKQAELEKEAESEAKLQQLERELQEKDTDVHELRRKLDAIQISYKKEMVKEKAQNKSFQKQLQALRADNELLQRKIRDSSTQSFFLSQKDFFNQDGVTNDPKSIFNGMDQQKKERLLARLRDIDLSGTLVKSSAKRPRAARRLSIDSHQNRLRLRSIATNGFIWNESMSDENGTTELTPPLGPNVTKARRMSDTSIIGPSRRGNSLRSILEMQSLQCQNSDKHEKEMPNGKVRDNESEEEMKVSLTETLRMPNAGRKNSSAEQLPALGTLGLCTLNASQIFKI
ncbi:uncharacterized protein LOC144097711 [Amblyomma americanum]